MKQLTDEELVSAHIQTRETQHFAQLYTRYYQKVHTQCLSFADAGNQAEDLTQDVFERVFQKLDTFSGNSRFSTWLYAVCRNYCLTEYQHQQRRSRATTIYGRDDDTITYPGTTSMLEQRLTLLELALTKLSDDERQLLTDRYEKNTSIDQLAGPVITLGSKDAAFSRSGPASSGYTAASLLSRLTRSGPLSWRGRTTRRKQKI